MATIAGHLIASRRRKLRLTRAKLAAIAKVGEVTLWRWERGKARNPGLEGVGRVASALGLDLSKVIVDGSTRAPRDGKK
jgi:transcriptional regulator with XRE-family HTH domain